jgi:hypothetical protein
MDHGLGDFAQLERYMGLTQGVCVWGGRGQRRGFVTAMQKKGSCRNKSPISCVFCRVAHPFLCACQTLFSFHTDPNRARWKRHDAAFALFGHCGYYWVGSFVATIIIISIIINSIIISSSSAASNLPATAADRRTPTGALVFMLYSTTGIHTLFVGSYETSRRVGQTLSGRIVWTHSCPAVD